MTTGVKPHSRCAMSLPHTERVGSGAMSRLIWRPMTEFSFELATGLARRIVYVCCGLCGSQLKFNSHDSQTAQCMNFHTCVVGDLHTPIFGAFNLALVFPEPSLVDDLTKLCEVVREPLTAAVQASMMADQLRAGWDLAACTGGTYDEVAHAMAHGVSTDPSTFDADQKPV